MNNKIFLCLCICFALIILGCGKDKTVSPQLQAEKKTTVSNKPGGAATQISGVGFYATATECVLIPGAAYAVRLTGDLEGCLFAFIDEFNCSPSGTYREAGREYFVGTYNGSAGSFWTSYKFEAKYEGCANNGAALGLEIFGRCQHPITAGSGEGVFEGVTGRIDMKDDIEAGNFPYRGHLKL